ncbi:hypothetical protein L6452_40727 [Arctium lappa]|uniref:Uncharacterized protein n=1 Tax=Arctium lappa TaxID=4217 RepID=A0ACB8XMP9_ARCLA|nr:hypothetical protein L6452_40727 [Arctium lappa]
MANRRGIEEVRDGEDLKFGGDGETFGGEVQGRRPPRTAHATAWNNKGQPLPRFGDWSEADEDAKPYTNIFNKVRKDRFYSTDENVENLDFGQDANRLDYFKVAPFNLHGDDKLNEIASYGGGGRTRQLAIENFANNDTRSGVKVVVTLEDWTKERLLPMLLMVLLKSLSLVKKEASNDGDGGRNVG